MSYISFNEVLLVVCCLGCCNAGERWLRDHPEASAKMMDLLTGVVIDYMAAQVRSFKSIMIMPTVSSAAIARRASFHLSVSCLTAKLAATS